jgi:regulator of sigma E protease
MFGVKVHEFMIGLPGPALRLHGKKTVYGITAIPLGGYVRIAGMEPGPENPLLGPALAAATRHGTIDADRLAQDLGIEIRDADDALVTLADWDALHSVEGEEYTYRSRFSPDEADDPAALLDRARQSTYRALPTWKRLVVLSAGVVLNLLTAVLVFTIVLSAFGYMKETGRLGDVNPGSGAAAAGIKAGDRLVSIGGSEIGGWQDVVLSIGRYQPGDEVTVVVSRDGKTLVLQATLGKRPGSSQALLGVSPELVATTPNVLQAVLLSFTYIGMTFEAIAGFFNPQTFQASVSGASSVIGASYYAAEAARAGALDYAGLVAVLSLSLGVINIFPIPPLDGGKIAVELFERLRGRPLSRRVSLSLSAAGAALLFALIAYLMYSDVVRYIVR